MGIFYIRKWNPNGGFGKKLYYIILYYKIERLLIKKTIILFQTMSTDCDFSCNSVVHTNSYLKIGADQRAVTRSIEIVHAARGSEMVATTE